MRNRFRQLHETGTFVMPNPWDVGSAKLLASLGFPALATTSLGYAATLGRADGQVTRDELLVHVESLVKAVEVPINVDAERCFGDDAREVARTARSSLRPAPPVSRSRTGIPLPARSTRSKWRPSESRQLRKWLPQRE